jgi:hypothetical protein
VRRTIRIRESNLVERQGSNVTSIEQLGFEPTCSAKKDNSMASPTTFRSPYDIRVNLVKDAILANSKLDDDAAAALAVHILHALNSIPEKVR